MDIIKSTAEYDALLKDNKSVFVDFYADWCGPCKMAGPVVEALAGIHTGVKFVKVNVDNNPDIAQRYGIMTVAPALTRSAAPCMTLVPMIHRHSYVSHCRCL